MKAAPSPRPEPHAPIRVLVVDDSVTMRQLLVDALSGDPDLQVVGAAPNGALALTMLPRTQPDCIILDIDMPVMGGLEFLERLRPHHPRLPVIVFSTLTTHGAETTLQAMWNGASDYVAKPALGDHEVAVRQTRAELVHRIKAFAQRGRRTGVSPIARTLALRNTTSARVPATGIALTPPPARVSLIGIGASTGGPRALVELLSGLPRDLEAPVLVVQHMPAPFTRHFTDGLACECALQVREAEQGVVLEPGTVWIAPGDHHLTVGRDGSLLRAWLDRSPAEHGCRPAVDPLLRSVAEVAGASSLAVILTGMGVDGTAGCAAVRAAHGQVVVQDEASSVVWGMPGAVVRAGLANAVLPLEVLSAEIVHRVRRLAPRRAA